jgi:hypothetical protein
MEDQSVLIPVGQTGQGSRKDRERTKLPRLNGADLYVARLGWSTHSSAKEVPCCGDDSAGAGADSPRRATGSLHEELLHPEVKPRPTPDPVGCPNEKQPSVLSSRPCYRCIAYMSLVGIKRVFWTTASGEWEYAKVRDLIDALENFGLEQPSDVATALNKVFVTKHEVLMLRRTMGDK